MTKLGLLLEFIGFAMLFWQSYARSKRKLEDGGGSATDPASEQIQIEKALNWLPSKLLRETLAKFWETFAFGLIALGVLLQLVWAGAFVSVILTFNQ
ncbi:MAG: hypothetical protein JRG73_13660 [Deltaproteobacteria bacterium]|nr:hypothetical protein [Deltaproteobacteria bacterium]